MEGADEGSRKQADDGAGNASNRRYARERTSGAKGLQACPEDDDVIDDGTMRRLIRHLAAAGACRVAARLDGVRRAHWLQHAEAQSRAAMALLGH